MHIYFCVCMSVSKYLLAMLYSCLCFTVYVSMYAAHLSHGGADLQDLLMTFDLPHADLTRELIGHWVVALQREGTMQRRCSTAPDPSERELLQREREIEVLRDLGLKAIL